MVQPLDTPTLPEWKTRPKRAFIGVFTSLGVGLALVLWLVARNRLAVLERTPEGAHALQRLRSALPGRRG